MGMKESIELAPTAQQKNPIITSKMSLHAGVHGVNFCRFVIN